MVIVSLRTIALIFVCVIVHVVQIHNRSKKICISRRHITRNTYTDHAPLSLALTRQYLICADFVVVIMKSRATVKTKPNLCLRNKRKSFEFYKKHFIIVIVLTTIPRSIACVCCFMLRLTIDEIIK